MSKLNPKDKSMFVVFEGMDGAGKTTVIQRMSEFFEKDKRIYDYFSKVYCTREPGGYVTQEFCQKIRKIVLDEEVAGITQALLFLACRAEHVGKFIKPTLAQGRTLILCDRFFLSTLVYQGSIVNNPDWVKLTQDLVSDVSPDITFYIEIEKDTFVRRHKERNKQGLSNYLDEYSSEHYDRISVHYKSTLLSLEGTKHVGKVILLDGEKGADGLLEEIQQKIIENL